MALSCHDRRLMSRLAFGRGWNSQAKLFSVRDFAGHKVAALSFGFAATVTGDSDIVATAAAPEGAGNNDAQRTSAISRLLKEDLIIETVSEPIGNGGLNLA